MGKDQVKTFEEFLQEFHPREAEAASWNGDSSGRIALARSAWEAALRYQKQEKSKSDN